MTDVLLQKGSVHFDTFTITNYDRSKQIDLSGNVVEMRITEDLMSPCITGAMQVREGTGLFTNFPLIGEETIEVSYKISPTEATPSFTKLFSVYSVSELEADPISPSQGYIYKLEFATPELLRNETTKINVGYRDISVSDIVRDIYTSYIKTDSSKNLVLEKTSQPQSFIVPSLKPFAAINLLASYADNGTTNNNNYFLFFEDQVGFNFINLYTLYKSNPVFSYKFQQDSAYLPFEDSPNPLTIPLGYKFKQASNKLSLIASGALGSRVMAVDEVAKTFSIDRYDYRTAFKSKPQLDASSYELVTKNYSFVDSGVYKVVPTTHRRGEASYFVANNRGPVYTKGYENLLSYRMAVLGQSHALELSLTVPGNTILSVGRIVTVDFPENSADPNANNITGLARYTGNYLIRRIDHMFKGNKYFMELTLIRDSYAAAIS